MFSDTVGMGDTTHISLSQKFEIVIISFRESPDDIVDFGLILIRAMCYVNVMIVPSYCVSHRCRQCLVGNTAGCHRLAA